MGKVGTSSLNVQWWPEGRSKGPDTLMWVGMIFEKPPSLTEVMHDSTNMPRGASPSVLSPSSQSQLRVKQGETVVDIVVAGVA